MNFREKIEERKRILNLFINNYPEGCLKITSGESHLHSKVKAEVFHWLKCNNYDVWSEATLKNFKSRPDIICLHKNGNSAYIIEIMVSESEVKALDKELKYPLPIIRVNAKDFDYSSFYL